MKGLKILVVEDQAIIAQDLIMKVKELGCSACSVRSAEAAIARIERNLTPDLILMDVELNGENGIQAARAIHNLQKIPVLFVTAYSRSSVLRAIQDLELTGYVEKPFRRKDLHASIRKLVAA